MLAVMMTGECCWAVNRLMRATPIYRTYIIHLMRLWFPAEPLHSPATLTPTAGSLQVLRIILLGVTGELFIHSLTFNLFRS